MRNVIVDGRVTEDAWQVVPAGESWSGEGDPIVHASDALNQLDALKATTKKFGVWLDGGDDVEPLRSVLEHVAIVAVRFPVFTDGRGFSTAVLLRRLGYAGELRSIGDVLRDQLLQMKRVGFTSFALREDRDAHDALAAFTEFSDAYQGVVGQPLPWFRRRYLTTESAS
ncbi:MAG TPA: DUF934 domain-containing protein [Burkholderiaceae bacterium]|nr:DUF934 domain-containing protein [Burkholderiaceae bacterium]